MAAGEAFDDDTWNIWAFEPGVIDPAGAGRPGLYRRHRAPPRRARRIARWRHAAFAGGMFSLFIALESPADYVAEHLFMAHQVQHMLLRMIAPMLIALSAPQAMLIGGLPTSLAARRADAVHGQQHAAPDLSWLTGPMALTILFLAALYVWEYPAYHDAALLERQHPRHHACHHADRRPTVLVADFRQRPAPAGLNYGIRLMMLWIVILSNIALGAYTTLKSVTLYPAYDSGRPAVRHPSADRRDGRRLHHLGAEQHDVRDRGADRHPYVGRMCHLRSSSGARQHPSRCGRPP